MDRKKLQQAIAHNSHFTSSRKVSLYSNFARLEETNPDGYWANIDAWKQVLEDAVSSHAFEDKTCISAGPELTAKLGDVNNGIPLSLNRVLDTMVADGTLFPLQEFKRQYTGTPQRSYISRAVGWAVGKIVGSSRYISAISENSDVLKQEKYVDMAALNSTTKALLSELDVLSTQRGSTQSAKVFDLQELQETLKGSFSPTDLDFCLALASFNNEIYYSPSEGLVKLRAAGPITENDLNIMSLNRHVQEVYLRELTLRNQISEFDKQARSAVKQGDRRTAKLLLQKKSMAEKSQDRTIAVIDQLEAVLQKIEDASDNKQAYAAFQASSDLLKRVNAGLSVENIDDVIEEMHGEMATTNEVTSQLSDLRISQPDRAVDEMELDDELEQMEKEEKDKKMARMPSVPQHRPSKAKEEQHEEQDRTKPQKEEQPLEALAS